MHHNYGEVKNKQETPENAPLDLWLGDQLVKLIHNLKDNRNHPQIDVNWLKLLIVVSYFFIILKALIMILERSICLLDSCGFFPIAAILFPAIDFIFLILLLVAGAFTPTAFQLLKRPWIAHTISVFFGITFLYIFLYAFPLLLFPLELFPLSPILFLIAALIPQVILKLPERTLNKHGIKETLILLIAFLLYSPAVWLTVVFLVSPSVKWSIGGIIVAGAAWVVILIFSAFFALRKIVKSSPEPTLSP